ncbi:MAG: hypothetical protein AAF997_18895 [Myxococcota bacterium]
MKRRTTVFVVLGSLVTALCLTAAGAIYLPIEMPNRLFAAGLSFVPVWVILAFVGIALKQPLYRIGAFVSVNAVCASAVAIHMQGLS